MITKRIKGCTKTGIQLTIDPDYVASIYSGRPGCMCGCKGNHRDNPLHVEQDAPDRYRGLTNRAGITKTIRWFADAVKISISTGFHGETIYYAETETDSGRRYCYCIYMLPPAIPQPSL